MMHQNTFENYDFRVSITSPKGWWIKQAMYKIMIIHVLCQKKKKHHEINMTFGDNIIILYIKFVKINAAYPLQYMYTY